MRSILATIFGIASFFKISGEDERLGLTHHEDKESYSLGYQFGQNLKSQGLGVNLDIYTSGIRDSLGGKKSPMSQEEIHATILELQRRITAAGRKELREKAEKNLAESKAFLEENERKEGVKTLPSGLQYKVIAEGTGKRPKPMDTVTVHYRGTLISGRESHSSYKRGQPATFEVKGLIRGWSEALQLMKEGSRWQLFIPPGLAYGERGAGPQIPPNSALIFEVELISVK
jgi:FKBP-type peptidyl-prolyl cis-trans isomerase FklB